MCKIYRNADDAIRALEAKCKKPTSSTKRSRKKAGISAAQALLAVPCAALTPFSFPLGVAPIMGVLLGKVSQSFTEAKEREIQRIGKEQVVLPDRGLIESVIKPGEKLSSLAGSRSGTRGEAPLNDLFPTAIAHLRKARYQWEQIIKNTKPIYSCADAESCYRSFVEVDYHFSKAKAYIAALNVVVTELDKYIKLNEDRLKQGFDKRKNDMKDWMKQDDSVHRKQCRVFGHCYRTPKVDRVPKKIISRGIGPDVSFK